MRLKSVLSALGIACALVIALDYASLAATGNSLVLGRLNKAANVTTIKRTTNGPAVSFVTKAGKPPFAVNRPAKVTRLNADLLDGLDSAAFARPSTTKVLHYTTSTITGTHTFPLGPLAAGFYRVSYTVNMSGAQADAGVPTVTARCYVRQVSPSSLIYDSLITSSTSVYTAAGTSPISLAATGVLDATNGTTPTLSCTSTRAWRTTSGAFPNLSIPVQITLTKLDAATVTSSSVN